MSYELVSRDPKYVKALRQEELILSATESVWELLEELSLTKADLAARLGTSRAHVSQLLSGTRNMTLRSLSDISIALGVRAHIKFEPLTASVSLESSEPLVDSAIDLPADRYRAGRLLVYSRGSVADLRYEADNECLFSPYGNWQQAA